MADTQPRPDIAQLVAEQHQAVYRYAYRLTGSVQDAEDLTQQTFLSAQRNLGQLRSVGMVKSWLFAILRNCFLRDRQKRRPVLATDIELRIDTVQADLQKEEHDRDQLQKALDQLPDAFRLATVMFYFEECSYQEIADRLDVPIGTVMSRLARAKANLRQLLLKSEQKNVIASAE
jgi:RNA polymerase sigma-70 factor, ECF subfamily